MTTEVKNRPKFIPTKPTGDDLYEGHSQERVANAIAAHISSIDSDKNSTMPRILGLEGEWGSGKSNVIKHLDEKVLCKNSTYKYYFFNYDAWGHQEDLQRRSILELLTRELIDRKILSGQTKMLAFDEKVDKEPEIKYCTWTEKLNSLVAKKSYTRTLTRPSVFNSTKFFGLALLFTGMMPALINALKLFDKIGLVCSIGVMFFPLALFFLLMFIASLFKKASFKEMWSMYNTSAQNNATAYSISELEPSVKEFREWMQDISKGIPENQKLVIVFDNMDRLPQDKVKTLWSSIHTFFAENGYNNIWCIIPYDRKHIAHIYEDKEDITTHFINKSFPVVYRVPAPVISDYKVVFDKFWDMAFSGVERITSEQRDVINRLYRKEHSIPNTRHIITYVNKIVSLYNMWGEEVSIESIALFALREQSILEKPETNILSSSYVKDVELIIPDTETLKMEMAALVYGVPKDIASQLPLKNYIKACLSSGKGESLKEYAKSNTLFFTTLEDEINNLESESVDTAAIVLNLLKDSEFGKEEKKSIKKCWNRLAKGYAPKQDGESDLREPLKLIISNSSKIYAKTVAQKFIDSIIVNESLEGFVYYNVFQALDTLMKSCELELLDKPSKVVSPELFVSYLKTAKNNYKVYPISCNATELSEACARWIDEKQDYVFVIDLLKDDKEYSFDGYLKQVEEIAASDKLTVNNVDNVIKSLNTLYTDYPSYSTNTISALNRVFSSMTAANNTTYYDVCGILISVGHEPVSITDDTLPRIHDSIIRDTLNSEGLLSASLKYQTTSLNRVLSYGINGRKWKGEIEDHSYMEQLATIKNLTSSTYENVINYLDGCKYHITEKDKERSIDNSINDIEWYKACAYSQTELAKEIINWFYDCLSIIPESSLVGANNVPQIGSYWLKALNELIETDKFSNNLPQNIKNVAGRVLLAIASGHIPTIEDTIYAKLLSNVTSEDISSSINEVLLDFCNNRKSLNPSKFILLHSWLEYALSVNASHHIDFLNQCLAKIIDDTNCQTIICQKKNLYQPMIQNHLSDASSILQKVKAIQDEEEYPNIAFKELIDSINTEI